MENDKLTEYETYRIVLDTRNLEINLFWQRSNYFLALNTALAVGVFKAGDRYSILLAALGVIASVLWFGLTLGSKFWQSRWEHRLSVYEGRVAPELQFFAADWKTIRADVELSLINGNHKGFRRLIDRLILMKPSVSYIMILLSLAFVAGWLLLLIMQLFK